MAKLEDVPSTPRPEPTAPTLVILRPDERYRGWYEDRPPQGMGNVRVRATVIGYRTYVLDGRVVTEAMVIPDEHGTSIGFIHHKNFVIKEGSQVAVHRPGTVGDPY